ncbi:ergothioneine biosynthesis protein EgtB [Shouchella shacheensis]|uniref:ergothioneine biosynthesis protein EgtB n=1 Tax=Shouchella shacheensis TaxID=1649580 RepID=UPI000740230A|nr:ergothioneine biosynthesis protein EgtB [Shouchella shacheensis]
MPATHSLAPQQKLLEDYVHTRKMTMKMIEPLEIEDFGVQAMEDVSPPKWHLAHTTWFFEEFILTKYRSGYNYYLEEAKKLFNSYYETLGKPFPRSKRGLIGRPTVNTILAYRKAVDEEITSLLRRNEVISEEILSLIRLGLQHEQQHQELLITDIKYNFSINPLYPAFQKEVHSLNTVEDVSEMKWTSIAEGLATIGTNEENFSFDNERPAHKEYLYPFSIALRPVTNKEFQEFIGDGGYTTPEHWLSDGWSTVKEEGWKAPLYWEEIDGVWHYFTLSGLQPVRDHDPVTHVSYYEADAFARWAGCRLPSEQEWECAFKNDPSSGQFLDSFELQPTMSEGTSAFGTVWEWTKSPYMPYPESARPAGALGEYNAKFMSNQLVLRGGSCATPENHIRLTYRNFFHPDKRWQFSGIRLAKDRR